MQKVIQKNLILSLMVLLCSYSTTLAAQCQRTFRLAYDKQHEHAQPGHTVLDEVLKRWGCKTEKLHLEATIARHHRALAEGKVDILGEASRLPDRERFAWFSLPYREEEVLIVAHRKNPRVTVINGLADIQTQRLRVLVDESGWWGPDVRRLLPQWRAAQLVLPVAEMGAGYLELQRQRGDVIITTDASLQAVQKFYPDIYIIKNDIHREPVHFMLSKKSVSEAELQAFNQHLAEVLKTTNGHQ